MSSFKMAASAISPTAITFYRLILALAIMGLFTAVPVWRNRKTILRHWPKLALYGALSSAVFQALSYRAAETTTATNMAILTALIPLLSMLLSVVILRDPLTLGMAAGGALSFLGLLYLVGQGDMLSVFQHGIHVGDGLMLMAAFSYALYGVLLRHWKVPVPAWQSTFVQSIFALLYMLPLYLRVPAAQAALDMKTIPLILYAGIFRRCCCRSCGSRACIAWGRTAAASSSTCCRCSPRWPRSCCCASSCVRITCWAAP